VFIRRFSIKNFKIHRDTSLELFPMTVFVGPNSGGKSAIFDALINFSVACRGDLSEAFNQYPFSFDALRHHGAPKDARIRYEVELLRRPGDMEALNYRFEFSQNPDSQDDPTYTIQNEELKAGTRVIFSRSDEVCKLPHLSNVHSEGRSIFAAIRRADGFDEFAKAEPLVAQCAREISRIGRYRLDPRLLAQPGRVFDVEPGEKEKDREKYATPRVAYRGEDLASVLYFLSETKSPVLQQIVDRVAEAIQGFERFEFNRVGSDRVGFSGRFADRRGTVVAPNLSDGCLSMIGLITLVLAPGRSGILCIEEPENGLTPRATRVFYETVRQLPVAEDHAQVLMSSHSPFVITEVWNGGDRDFIYQCNPVDGTAKVVKFSRALEGTGSLRTGEEIGLRQAELVMDGYLYQPS
jgi:predicted ATPase